MADVKPSDILLRVGGRTLARHGVLAVAGSRRGPVELPFTHTRASAQADTYIDRDGLIRKAAANVPRIEWVDLDGDGVRETPGILPEGSRTNSLSRSEEMDDAVWQKTRASITANATTAPDGTSSADKLVEDTTAGATHFLARSLTITADERLADSLFIKAAERTRAKFFLTDGAGGNGVTGRINLGTGAITDVAAVGTGTLRLGALEKVGASGWYRVKLGGAIGGGITSGWLILMLEDAAGNTAYTGDGASGMYVWGGQYERGVTFPSSYIPTVASAVTRAADSFTVPMNFGTSANLTVLARIARPVHADASGDVGSAPGICEISDNATPKVRLFYEAANRSVSWQLIGATANSIPSAAIPAGASQTYIGQVKNIVAGGQAALDVGGGLGAFGTVASAAAAYGVQRLRVGECSAASPLYGVLIDLMIARGLFTHAEMSAVP